MFYELSLCRAQLENVGGVSINALLPHISYFFFLNLHSFTFFSAYLFSLFIKFYGCLLLLPGNTVKPH